MDFGTLWQQVVFSIGQKDILLGRLILVGLALLVLYVLGFFMRRRWLQHFFDYEETGTTEQKSIRRIVVVCLVLLAILIGLLGLKIDFPFSNVENFFLSYLKMSTVVGALLIYFTARLVDELLSGLLSRRYQQRREQQLKDGGLFAHEATRSRIKVSHIVQPIVYLIALTFIVQQLNLDVPIKMPWSTGDGVLLNRILSAALILLFTRLFLWILTEIILFPYYKQKEINPGSQYAINRLLTYFILVLAMVGTMQYIGINLNVLLGGAAALLVGIGLGLQQTFNDLICGIILLFERTVEIGDVVDINGLVGTVKRIGLRTSLVETRDLVSVIVPNSKLVADNVVNWSHFDAKTRFRVAVGVAYGSDTEMVKSILLEVASENPRILRRPQPIVRFVNFGNSSLDFELLFWSKELIPIEDVKSDLRVAIDRRFREAKVTIPFPQQDIWIRKEPSDE